MANEKQTNTLLVKNPQFGTEIPKTNTQTERVDLKNIPESNPNERIVKEAPYYRLGLKSTHR